MLKTEGRRALPALSVSCHPPSKLETTWVSIAVTFGTDGMDSQPPAPMLP